MSVSAADTGGCMSPPSLIRREGLAKLPPSSVVGYGLHVANEARRRLSDGARHRLSDGARRMSDSAKHRLSEGTRRASGGSPRPRRSASDPRRASAPARLDEALALIPWTDISLCAPIGSGTSADVYEADVASLGKVAVKLFRASQVSTTELFSEAKLLLGLHHPCVVATLGLTSDGGPYRGIVMEKMERSLASLLSSAQEAAQLSWERPFQRICEEVARGMAFLHSHNVLHRDLKPANVLLGTAPLYRAKVSDLGSARQTDPSDSFTFTALRGTPAFMAPEVIRRERYDQSADVWSFGCLLVHVATRRHPYLALLERGGASHGQAQCGGRRVGAASASSVEAVMGAVASGEVAPTADVPADAWPARVSDLAEMCTLQARDERPSFHECARALGGQGLSTFRIDEIYFGASNIAGDSTLVSASI